MKTNSCPWCKGSGAIGVVSNDELRKEVIAGKGDQSLKAYAKKLKVSFQFLGKVMAGIYKPGPTIAKALGYEQVPPVIYYRKKLEAKTVRKALKAITSRMVPRLPKEGWKGARKTTLKKPLRASKKKASKKK